MRLKYAANRFKQARRERQEAEAREKYYREAVLEHCQKDRNTDICGLRITWVSRTHISADLIRLRGLDPNDFRTVTGRYPVITISDEEKETG